MSADESSHDLEDLFPRLYEELRRIGCGCAVVGDEKKGKYVYCRCSGMRGACEARSQGYIREAVIDQSFAEVLSSLYLDETLKAWAVEAMHESKRDEVEFREAAIKGLTADLEKTQKRLDRLFEDRLDDLVDDDTHERQAKRLRKRRDELRAQIESHAAADDSDCDMGVRILELLQRLPELWVAADPAQKREILQIVHSNSTRGLEAELQEPLPR